MCQLKLNSLTASATDKQDMQRVVFDQLLSESGKLTKENENIKKAIEHSLFANIAR